MNFIIEEYNILIDSTHGVWSIFLFKFISYFAFVYFEIWVKLKEEIGILTMLSWYFFNKKYCAPRNFLCSQQWHIRKKIVCLQVVLKWSLAMWYIVVCVYKSLRFSFQHQGWITKMAKIIWKLCVIVVEFLNKAKGKCSYVWCEYAW
jgi:hypothetical protein